MTHCNASCKAMNKRARFYFKVGKANSFKRLNEISVLFYLLYFIDTMPSRGFVFVFMKKSQILTFAVAMAFSHASSSLTAAQGSSATSYAKPTSFPFQSDPAFSFRKTITQTYDQTSETRRSNSRNRVGNSYLDFEKKRLLRGAITPEDFRQKQGNYYSFFWRATRDASVTVRFEYRQANLGSHVQVLAAEYPNAKGSHKTDFAIVGDDYLNDGRVIAWRAMIIENGRIVASTQSFLWR